MLSDIIRKKNRQINRHKNSNVSAWEAGVWQGWQESAYRILAGLLKITAFMQIRPLLSGNGGKIRTPLR